MSNKVSVAGTLTEDPDLAYTREGAKRVVEVNDYFGVVGGWVNRWAVVRTESTRRSSAARAV